MLELVEAEINRVEDAARVAGKNLERPKLSNRRR
jgi:hypothetical protein